MHDDDDNSTTTDAQNRGGRKLSEATELCVHGRKCTPDGSELSVDVTARGWPAIVALAVVMLAAAILACGLLLLRGDTSNPHSSSPELLQTKHQ